MSKLSSYIKRNVRPKVPLNYQCAVFDNSVKNPFLLTSELMKRMDVLQTNYVTDYDLAKGIFEYLQSHITYGFINKKHNGYGTSTEVWENKEGICGEMTFLYTTLARYCSLHSACVDVKKDNRGRKVNHMCSQVLVPEPILVDIAYNTFDISHKKYTVVNDAYVLRLFSSWRR